MSSSSTTKPTEHAKKRKNVQQPTKTQKNARKRTKINQNNKNTHCHDLDEFPMQTHPYTRVGEV